MKYVIRPMSPAEYPLLREFLYQAIFIPEGVTPPPREIILRPELQLYIADFGCSPHDRAFCAVCGDQTAGAVWVRIMHDYGHIDDETPSLAISLLPEYRGQGIGTALMQTMLHALRGCGYRQLSLSVQKENAAFRLYQRLGFTVAGGNSGEYLMVYRF